VEVQDIQGRFRVMVGKGEIRFKGCKGIFNLASGKGDIEMERCVEADMPERPPMPEPQFQAAQPEEPTISETPGAPGEPGMTGEFRVHIGRGPRMHHRIKSDVPWDWFGFDAYDWSDWGTQFGEQARVWAQQFASHFIGTVDWLSEKAGVNVRSGKGDTKLQDLVARACSVKLASGDVELKGGWIESLIVDISHGGVKCESVLPAGDWAIAMRNGDVSLALPSNTQARLDVATRHGDIDSQVPLVRVGRPGPESRYGGRMVGTLGQSEDNIAQVSVTALHGDISIRLMPEKSKFSPKPARAGAASDAKPPERKPAGAPAADSTVESATTPMPPTGTGGAAIEADKPDEKASTTQAAPTYESQLAILQALSTGQITVEEAEKLLRSMPHATGEPKNVWGTVKGLFSKA
jgi:hypothetical protein